MVFPRAFRQPDLALFVDSLIKMVNGLFPFSIRKSPHFSKVWLRLNKTARLATSTKLEKLGHATAAFTLDKYGHFTERMKQDSAIRMESFMKDVLNL